MDKRLPSGIVIEQVTEKRPGGLDRAGQRRKATTREELAMWVGREILPHERDVRSWLERRFVADGDVEDIVQDCYCSLAQLRDVSHIDHPRAYFFTMARHLAFRQRRQATVVRMEAMSDPELEADLPSPERFAVARDELGRVEAALKTLSERARRIFVMRRIDGLSQKEIARIMGVSEAVVENEASRSLRRIMKLVTEPDRDAATPTKGAQRAGSH